MKRAPCHFAGWVITVVLLGGLFVGLVAGARPAAAQDAEDAPVKPSYRVVVDRILHEPSALGGTRLMIELSALTLQGQRLDLTDPKTIQTYVGASELRAPYALGTYDATDGATAIVVVLQATLEYDQVLPVIAETFDQAVLDKLPERAQVAVLAYGEQVGGGKLSPLKTARAKLKEASSDGSQGDPALIETVERALMLLRKVKTDKDGRPLRKLIVVISDGKDRAGDRERVTRLGAKAAKDGVRIHTLAFSPSDQRRPLLLLGELAKKSLGTFRWLRNGTPDAWTAQFAQLHDEIQKQYVLTYFVSAEDDPGGKKLKVVTVGRTEATTADRQPDLKVPAPACADEPCGGYCVDSRCIVPQVASGRGILGWAVLVGGGALGVILLLGLIGFLMSRRGARVVPGVPPGAFPPGVAPVRAPVAAPAAGPVPWLMFVNGPRAGERLPLRHGFMIGKAPGCDLLLEDGYTSGHHAQIGMDGRGGWRLYDRGSTNGTHVNGARVTEVALEHGTTVRIGSTDLRFLAQ